VLKRAREVSPQTLVLVMTAHGSVETAVEALRAGATDYILKPVVFDELLAKVERLIELRQLMWQAQMLRREVEARYDFEGLVGQSRAMRDIFDLVRKVAPTQSTVLITGESGTGKEVVAARVHHFSRLPSASSCPSTVPRSRRTCSRASSSGTCAAPSPARSPRRRASSPVPAGGTIFLDEIGDMPFGLQSKLLRAIETKEVLPVGSTQTIAVDRAHRRREQPRPPPDGRRGESSARTSTIG
jgi:DNA-binding NtrC family response regulator